ncbi:MAG: DUF1415 domain-containing protein [bacterium]
MPSPIDATRYWLEKTIIAFNFCPFAKKEFISNRIHYELVDDANLQEQLLSLMAECHRLDNEPEIETALVIYPKGLDDFNNYLDFLDLANQALVESGYEGVYQLASFHPDYCFEGIDSNDPSNFTNRSPYPLIHIIREQSLERVLASYPDPEQIPERNIALARDKGTDVFKAVLEHSQQQDE